jgi:hypothetical protein
MGRWPHEVEAAVEERISEISVMIIKRGFDQPLSGCSGIDDEKSEIEICRK